MKCFSLCFDLFSGLNDLPVKTHEATLLHLTNGVDIVSLHFTVWLEKPSCFIFFLQDLNLKIQKVPFGAQIYCLLLYIQLPGNT